MWNDTSILCGAESMFIIVYFLKEILHAHLFYRKYIIAFVSVLLQGISDV